MAALRLAGLFAATAALPAAVAAAWLYGTGAAPPGFLHALGLAALAASGLAAALVFWQQAQLARRVAEFSESMRDVTKENFPVSVAAALHDEFAQLADAFNDMARELGARNLAQGLLARMDDALLTKLDLNDLVRNALRCLCDATRAELAVLAIHDRHGAGSMQVFLMRRADRSRVERLRLPQASEVPRDATFSANFETVNDVPLPASFTNTLRRDHGIRQFFALPVSRAGQNWGVLASGHKEPARLTPAQAQLLGGVVDRLVAGLRASEQERKLHALTYVDRLTRLPNRARFQALVAEQLAVAVREKQAMGILYVGLDHFKQVNDGYSQAVGDKLLKEAAKRIRERVIDADVVARVGGDKFGVILAHVATRRDAARVARSLIQSLSQAFDIDGKLIYTGASVGVAMYPECGDQDAEIWKMAETAMVKAKRDGRNRLAFYDKRMNAQSRRRAELDAELRHALTRDELVLHYQPQIDLASGALCGVEALVRWQHPTRGLLLPAEFIEHAEQIGLIPEIGAWVLREACLQHRRWRAQGVDVPRISVNASNGQLPRSNFVAMVRQIVRATQLPPGVLELEVTESMLVEGGDAALEALEQLTNDDGINVAIDDFGTGYSSFNYLKIMPARVLKLDMSFIVDVKADNVAGKIVSAMINMAHALHKEVVAEGIERTDQLLLLKQLGCDRGQGYLLGRPVEAEKIGHTYAGTWHGERPQPLNEIPPLGPITIAPQPAGAGGGQPRIEPEPWSEEDLLEQQLTVPRVFADGEV